MPLNLANLAATNNSLWHTCEVLPGRIDEVMQMGNAIISGKVRYEGLGNDTKVPWWFIGIVHYREASLSWSKSIAQGDPWNQVSRHVPRGRGPFRSWHEAGYDALVKCPPFAARWTDWSMGGALTIAELYNGTGYEEYHHENSPYNWGATNHEERGKYVADGKYDLAAWDSQIGAAALMKAIFAIDQGVSV